MNINSVTDKNKYFVILEQEMVVGPVGVSFALEISHAHSTGDTQSAGECERCVFCAESSSLSLRQAVVAFVADGLRCMFTL